MKPNFPVKVIRNMMFSFEHYVTGIGAQYSILAAIVAGTAQLLLYPVLIKDLGDKLEDHEVQ